MEVKLLFFFTRMVKLQGQGSAELGKLQETVLVVLLRWAAELHLSCSLTPPPQRESGRKYDEKASRVEIAQELL